MPRTDGPPILHKHPASLLQSISCSTPSPSISEQPLIKFRLCLPEYDIAVVAGNPLYGEATRKLLVNAIEDGNMMWIEYITKGTITSVLLLSGSQLMELGPMSIEVEASHAPD